MDEGFWGNGGTLGMKYIIPNGIRTVKKILGKEKRVRSMDVEGLLGAHFDGGDLVFLEVEDVLEVGEAEVVVVEGGEWFGGVGGDEGGWAKAGEDLGGGFAGGGPGVLAVGFPGEEGDEESDGGEAEVFEEAAVVGEEGHGMDPEKGK